MDKMSVDTSEVHTYDKNRADDLVVCLDSFLLKRRTVMKIKKIIMLMFVMFALLLVGCEKDGPAENVGKKIDNTVENAGDKTEEAVEKTGDKIKEMGDSIKDSTN